MSRQNYYARRRERQRRTLDAQLVLEQVRAVRRELPRLGTRKLVHQLGPELALAGVSLGRDHFFDLLRAHDLLVPPRRAEFPGTTQFLPYLPVFPNRVKGMIVSRPHQVLVVDLTYVRTREGFLYLWLLTDKYSRKIVGWHATRTMETSGALVALALALAQLPPGARPIHHSDRGSQYASHEYVKALQAAGLEISMTEVNHCAENALAERMNGILKGEFGLGGEFGQWSQARAAAAQAVSLYNERRPHGALNYAVPAQVHSLAA